MKMNKVLLVSTLGLALISVWATPSVRAAEKAKKASDETEEKESPDAGANFRCEKMRDGTLAKLKEKLVSNCNLNKPFSFSAAETLEVTYTYCCTKN